MVGRHAAAALCFLIVGAALAYTAAVIEAKGALSQEAVVAMIDGKPISETDVRLAEIDLAALVGQMPAAQRRHAVVQYLIESQLLSVAAEESRLNVDPKYDAHLTYAKRRILRDQYLDANILTTVTEADARRLYDEQVKNLKSEDEVHARHIMMDNERQLRELRAKILNGSAFAKLAQEFSTDPGTNWKGGDLGYFVRGQMDEKFEAAAFALQRGGLSEPVRTQFGWHLILLEDKRIRPVPEFDAVKGLIRDMLIQRKAQEAVAPLRAKASIELLDPALKELFDTKNRGGVLSEPLPSPAATENSTPVSSRPNVALKQPDQKSQQTAKTTPRSTNQASRIQKSEDWQSKFFPR